MMKSKPVLLLQSVSLCAILIGVFFVTPPSVQASSGGPLEQLGDLLGIDDDESSDSDNTGQTESTLDIPEAEPLGNNGATTANTSGFLVFEDLGYKIEYPADWEVVAPGLQYGLSAFRSPDGSAITVKFISSEDSGVDNIEELFELFQEDADPLTTYHMNSTTTLGGLPGFITTGVSTYTPTVLESLAGERGYTNRVYNVWGHSENMEGFYGLLFGAASKAQYDETLPIAKKIIDSFTVDAEPLVLDTQEEAEEADDTFVGSAGNGEDDDDDDENADDEND